MLAAPPYHQTTLANTHRGRWLDAVKELGLATGGRQAALQAGAKLWERITSTYGWHHFRAPISAPKDARAHVISRFLG